MPTSLRPALLRFHRRAALNRPWAWLIAFFVLAVIARAQAVHWENSDAGDPSELELVFQECSPNGDPKLPHVDGVTFALEGTSTQANMVNFSVTRYTILTYRVRSTKGGALQIPAFDVATDKGTKHVPAFRGGAMRTASDLNVSSRIEMGSPTVWVGEVFPITYTLDVSRRTPAQPVSNIDWNSSPLVIEDWSKFEPNETVVNGEPRYDFIARTRGYAKTPGPLTLNTATELVNVQTGSMGFGLFQAPRIEQLTVESSRPSILVRALPTPAPADFAGAVGQFKFNSKVVPTTAAVGEPVTWTLELSGSGNWPDIAGLPQREVSKDFDVVQPKAKRTPAEGKLFDATLTEDVVLVPTKAGTYTLGPVNFAYFDPRTGEYKTLSTPQTTITITPPANAATHAPKESASPGNSAPQIAPLDKAKLADLKSKVPAAPSGLPRDPLTGTATTFAPMALRTVLLLVLAPLAIVLIAWILLAMRRAQKTDPLRPRREARARLAVTLEEIKRISDPAQQAKLLLRWQHDAAILFQIRHAAPSAAVFDVASAQGGRPPVLGAAAVDPAWQALWREADRALYSENNALPPDWAARAEAALAAQKLPGFSPLRLFLPRNLLPFVAAVALAVTIATPRARAAETPALRDDPAKAYHAGDFAGAEAGWAAAISKNPRDAIARYNLSLALAQQDRWGEAAAQATAAFVQQPDNPAMRWQLALTCEKAGYTPAPLVHFLPAGPTQSLAGLASPGGWQWLAVGAAGGIGLALVLLLLEIYGRRSIWRQWTAVVVGAASLLLGASAVISLATYGPTVDHRAVIVWQTGTLRSIPTEADTTQKTTPLPAGSVAVVNKTLFGWVRLAFENGQTGWVRKEEVVGLWE